MKFKVGDKIKCVHNDDGSSTYVGSEGKITYVYSDNALYPYSVSFCSALFSEKELELLTKKSIMNIKESFLQAFLKEPQKSFRKAGITNGDGFLTSDGQAVFLGYLLEKNGDDFKATVVDPILADQKESK